MKYIGLTGSIGAGKSTASQILVKYGAKLIDADKLAVAASQKASPAFKELQTYFGDCFDKNQNLDRLRLAKKVFASRDALKILNHIMLPVIHQLHLDLLRDFFKEDPSSIIVYDAALIFEEGLNVYFQKVILIVANKNKSWLRLSNDRNISKLKFEAVLSAQLANKEKINLADNVIKNDASVLELEKKLGEVWKEILKLPSIDMEKMISLASLHYT